MLLLVFLLFPTVPLLFVLPAVDVLVLVVLNPVAVGADESPVLEATVAEGAVLEIRSDSSRTV